MKRLALALLGLALSACGKRPTIEIFLAAPASMPLGGSSVLLFSVNDAAKVVIDHGVGDVTGRTQVAVSPAATTTYALTATASGGTVSASTTVTVVPAAATGFLLSGPASPVAGVGASFTLVAVDASGLAQPNYRGTVAFSSDDAAAVLPANVTFAAADAGKRTLQVTFQTAGTHLLIAADTQAAGAQGVARVSVVSAAAASFSLTGVPSAATPGAPFGVTLVVRDAFGNAATGYRGTVHVTSSDPGAVLPPNVSFGAGDLGRHDFAVTLNTAGPRTVTFADVATASLTATSGAVAVGSAQAAHVVLSGLPGSADAGVALTAVATVKDGFGNTAQSYTGTLHFASSDSAAPAVPDQAVTAAALGTVSVPVSFATAGLQTLTVMDLANSALNGSAQVRVSADAASSCTVDLLSATLVAGAAASPRVTFKDGYGNVASSYAGTVTLTSSDGRAVLPASTAYAAADQGAHVFALQLLTTGSHTVTATDNGTPALHCQGTVTVTPAAPHYLIALPTDSNAGATQPGTLTVVDTYGNGVPQYAGTVSLTSSDSRAVLPAPLVFNGTQNGSAAISVQFGSLGVQTVTGKEQGNPTVTGAGTTAVHGLVYTNPPAAKGAVQLIANAASTPSLVQLDLVAAQAVPNAFGIGMNLPADPTRVVPDSTLLMEGNAFNTGAPPKAVGAALPATGPTAGLLFTGLSQKLGGAGAVRGDVPVSAGALYYSIRLRLNPAATVGVLFDGNAGTPIPKFRAAIRDYLGDDTVAQSRFAIGRLEVR